MGDRDRPTAQSSLRFSGFEGTKGWVPVPLGRVPDGQGWNARSGTQ